MLTSSDAFIILNEVLNDQDTQVIKATATITEIRVITGERTEVRAQLEKLLANKGVKIIDGQHSGLTRNAGSFGGTEFDTQDEKIRLIYKPKGNKGSGGGAEATRLNESAQCVYAAIAFGLGRDIKSKDVTEENVNKFANTFQVDGKIGEILNQLNSAWIASSVAGANKLYDKFGSKGKYTFHRGSGIVNRIEAGFKRAKKLENVRMDVNKWNPADIWMVKNGFKWDCLDKDVMLLGYNQCIQESLEHNELMGISLKKITGAATISPKNIFTDMKRCKKYVGYEYSKKSMDGYIILSGGTKIQYRSFGGPKSLTGFQGEVKGSAANQGKISLGPTNMVLRAHRQQTVPTNAAQRVRDDRGGVWTEIVQGLKTYGKMSDKEINTLARDTKTVTDAWLYSKLQVTQLLNIITPMKNSARDELVEDLYLYASSQSKFSGAYYKLE